MLSRQVDFISGSSGFLGSALLARLGGQPVPHSLLETLVGGPNDRFFFLSAYGNMYGQTDAKKMIQANVLDMLSVYRANNFRSFVYVSTSSVHLSVQTPYSRTKRAAEELLQALGGACIIRPYSITGVGEQAEHLIPRLIRSCLYGEEMPFTISATHDFIDVSDVVDAILHLADSPYVYELGLGKAVSNREVKDIVEALTGRKANLKHTDFIRDYDSLDWRCKDFSAQSFGWKPKKTLEESITEMVYVARKESESTGERARTQSN